MEERRPLLSDTDHGDYLSLRTVTVRNPDRAGIQNDPGRAEGSSSASSVIFPTASASESKPTEIQTYFISGEGDFLKQFQSDLSLNGEDAYDEDGENDIARSGRTGASAKRRALIFMALLTILTMITQVAFTILQPAVQGSLKHHIVCGQSRHIGCIYFFSLFSSASFAILLGMLLTLLSFIKKQSMLECPVPFRVCIAASLSATLGSILSMYSSPADRTPVFIQPLLSTAVIPITVILRFVVLRKGLSKAQVICTLATVVGTVIAMEPVFTGSNSSSQTSTSNSIIFSCLFFLSFAPFALQSIITEGALKKTWIDSHGKGRKVNALSFLFWVNAGILICIGPLFFIDFLPWFGSSHNFDQFSSSMKTGFHCMFGSTPSPTSYPNCTIEYMITSNDPFSFNPDPNCTTPILRMWLYVIAMLASQLCLTVLIQSSQGAVFASLVIILCAPVGSVFWMLVKLDRRSVFHWQPTFGTSSVYTFAGLLITVPAVAAFQYLEIQMYKM